MKTKEPVSTKKQSVALKDLKSKKNPKGGAQNISISNHNPHPGIADQGAAGGLSSY
jgi:hypothetical protein